MQLLLYYVKIKKLYFMGLNPINQQNDVLILIIRDNFDQNLKNLPSNLQSLTLGDLFNQKLENLPNNLQN